MYDDEPEGPEPTALEQVTQAPAPSTVVLQVTGYDALRVEEMVVERLASQLAQQMRGEIEKRASERPGRGPIRGRPVGIRPRPHARPSEGHSRRGLDADERVWGAEGTQGRRCASASGK